MRSKVLTWLTCGLIITLLIVKGCDMMEPKMPVTKTDFPTGNITMIVPFGVGGGTDLQARALEKMFPKYLNKALVVTNKPGAGGMIGWNDLAMAQPDGYTLGISAIDLIMQSIVTETKYHYPSALDPIAQMSSTPFILVTNLAQPWNNADELIQYAKQNPGKLKLGHEGIGAVGHILGTNFSSLSDIEIEQVPFQGGSEVVSALLGNHVQAAFISPAVSKEQIKAGKVKPLGITSEQRLTDVDLAEIPTLQEQGIDLVLSIWVGVAAPRDLPKNIKEKLNLALEQMVNDPEFKSTIEKLGLQVDYLNAEQSKEKWVQDIKKLNKMLKDTGIAEQIKAQRK